MPPARPRPSRPERRGHLPGAVLLLVAIAPSAVGCAPPGPRAGHAALNGIRMYYEEYGQGPVLILL
ncbi:MAG TPA: hypothetical protein VI792_07345, partial [Candidatus Eisenbacteria bacterium]